nr:hypothetical protein [Rhizobium halophytocola]
MATALASCNSTGSGLGFGKSNPPADAGRAAAVVQGICPPLELRTGTAFYRTYANGGKDDPEKVIYQASLADSTRACTRNDTSLGVKVMVQGRLIAGPVGKAGTVQLPIRVEVVQGDQVIYSELTQFPVTLADADLPQQFLFTKDVAGLPGDITGFAKVYVGFDDGAKTKKR